MKTIVDNIIEALEARKIDGEKTNLSPKTHRELCEVLNHSAKPQQEKIADYATPVQQSQNIPAQPVRTPQVNNNDLRTPQPSNNNLRLPQTQPVEKNTNLFITPNSDDEIIVEGNPNSSLIIIIEKPGDTSAFQFYTESPEDLLTNIIEKGMKFKREDMLIIKIPDNIKCYEKTKEVIIKNNPKNLLFFGMRILKILLKEQPPLKEHLGKKYSFENIPVTTVHNLTTLVRNSNKEKSVTWGIIQDLLKSLN